MKTVLLKHNILVNNTTYEAADFCHDTILVKVKENIFQNISIILFIRNNNNQDHKFGVNPTIRCSRDVCILIIIFVPNVFVYAYWRWEK